MAQQALRAVKLCAYDLASEKETVVYEETNEEGFFLNELEAVADGVFWVRTEGGQKTIEKLDLATKEVQVIEQYDQEAGDILLQSDGKYLTWYCTAGDPSRGIRRQKTLLFLWQRRSSPSPEPTSWTGSVPMRWKRGTRP